VHGDMLMELTKPWLPQTSRIWFRKPHWCVRANHFVSKAAVETAAIKIVFVTLLGHWALSAIGTILQINPESKQVS